MRAGAHAVEAERAVEVAADLRREEQGAATGRALRPVAHSNRSATWDLVHAQQRRGRVIAVDAFMADAVAADVGVFHRDLCWRAGRIDES